MYTPLALYYLQQMGVRPWISNLKLCNKLIIICPFNQNKKAEVLLKGIMDFIKCLKLQASLIELNLNDDCEIFQQRLQASRPAAVLNLGVDLAYLKDFKLNCPIYSNSAPEVLLNNPLAKKRIFLDIWTHKESTEPRPLGSGT